MLLTIHNLPKDTLIQEIKSFLREKCGLSTLILDNLEREGASKKVTVGLANDGDAAILMRKINGLFMRGNHLMVEVNRKSQQMEQPFLSTSLFDQPKQPLLMNNTLFPTPFVGNMHMMGAFMQQGMQEQSIMGYVDPNQYGAAAAYSAPEQKYNAPAQKYNAPAQQWQLQNQSAWGGDVKPPSQWDVSHPQTQWEQASRQDGPSRFNDSYRSKEPDRSNEPYRRDDPQRSQDRFGRPNLSNGNDRSVRPSLLSRLDEDLFSQPNRFKAPDSFDASQRFEEISRASLFERRNDRFGAPDRSKQPARSREPTRFDPPQRFSRLDEFAESDRFNSARDRNPAANTQQRFNRPDDVKRERFVERFQESSSQQRPRATLFDQKLPGRDRPYQPPVARSQAPPRPQPYKRPHETAAAVSRFEAPRHRQEERPPRISRPEPRRDEPRPKQPRLPPPNAAKGKIAPKDLNRAVTQRGQFVSEHAKVVAQIKGVALAPPVLKCLKNEIRSKLEDILKDDYSTTPESIAAAYHKRYTIKDDAAILDRIVREMEAGLIHTVNKPKTGLGFPTKVVKKVEPAPAKVTSAPLKVPQGPLPKYPNADKALHKSQKKATENQSFQLEKDVEETLMEELNRIDAVVEEVCSIHTCPPEKFVCESIRQSCLGDIKQELRTLVARRLDPQPGYLTIRVFFTFKPPPRDALNQFLKTYRVVSCAKSVKGKFFVVTCADFKGYDALIALGSTFIGDQKLIIKPLGIAKRKTTYKENFASRQQYIAAQKMDFDVWLERTRLAGEKKEGAEKEQKQEKEMESGGQEAVQPLKLEDFADADFAEEGGASWPEDVTIDLDNLNEEDFVDF